MTALGSENRAFPGQENRLLLFVALWLLVLAAYAPAMRGGYVWDDREYVSENPTLRSAEGLRRIWFDVEASQQYYPLAFSSFWLEYHIWGQSPAGYHVVNILLHGLNAGLLWLVLRRLDVPGAWLAAALFALHPVHVESVAWIQERKNILSGAFYLASALAYFRVALPATPAIPALTPAGWRACYGLALLLFLCALLSKTAACTLPPALLLVLWWKTGCLPRRQLPGTVPFFCLAIAFGLLTMWVEKRHVGAEGPDWDWSLSDRVLIAGRALWFYLAKLLWPRETIFFYPRWDVSSSAIWQYSFPAAALLAFVILWLLRSRIGRGPLTAVLFFAGTLAPTLGFVNLYFMRYSYVADHFQYLASIGILALASGLAVRVYRPRHKKTLHVLGGVVLVFLGVLTWRQSGNYDEEAIWIDTLAKNPDCWPARQNLGKLYLQRGDVERAEPELARAVRLQPGYGLLHVSWGEALVAQGRLEEAAGQFSLAAQLSPGLALAYLNLGVVRARQGRNEEAAAAFSDALRVHADYPLAHYYLGLARQSQEKNDDARLQFHEALRLQPDFAEAHFALAELYAAESHWPAAADSYRRAVALRPSFLSYRQALVRALEQAGQSEAAAAERLRILRLETRQGSGGLH